MKFILGAGLVSGKKRYYMQNLTYYLARYLRYLCLVKRDISGGPKSVHVIKAQFSYEHRTIGDIPGTGIKSVT